MVVLKKTFVEAAPLKGVLLELVLLVALLVGGGLNTNQLPKSVFYNKGTRQRNTKPSPPKDNSRSVDRIPPLKF